MTLPSHVGIRRNATDVSHLSPQVSRGGSIVPPGWAGSDRQWASFQGEEGRLLPQFPACAPRGGGGGAPAPRFPAPALPHSDWDRPASGSPPLPRARGGRAPALGRRHSPAMTLRRFVRGTAGRRGATCGSPSNISGSVCRSPGTGAICGRTIGPPSCAGRRVRPRLRPGGPAPTALWRRSDACASAAEDSPWGGMGGRGA